MGTAIHQVRFLQQSSLVSQVSFNDDMPSTRSVYWSGMSADLTDFFNECYECNHNMDKNKKLEDLPEDVINHHILSYVGEFLDLSDGIEHFWINLGIESCNLRKMSWYSYSILQHSFGKTKYKFVYRYGFLI